MATRNRKQASGTPSIERMHNPDFNYGEFATIKSKVIDVQGRAVTVLIGKEQNYISLTDMVRNIANGLALIEKWLRNKNIIEFSGIWEEIYNPDFNSPEFEGIKSKAGLNRYLIEKQSVGWVRCFLP